jgi:hypothetical protein
VPDWNVIYLGTKTIYVDNANAVKPFGAIIIFFGIKKNVLTY